MLRTAFVFLGLACCMPASGAAADFRVNGVTAHRGDSWNHPENTLAAFSAGIAAGADWIELDVLLTRDRQLVVSHDPTTGRVGDRDLVIADATLAELSAVDVATAFRSQHGLTLQSCPRQTLPLLREVLAMVMRQQRTRVSIQPKCPCITEAVALVRQLGAEPWVGFNDGSLALMSEVKRLAPELPVFWDRGEGDIAEDIRIAKANGFEALVINHKALTPAKVASLRQAGLAIGVWTVNDPAAWTRFLDMGVQRIYTDRPADLLAHQARRGFGSVACQGAYPMHLQGVCTNDRDAIYWSWTDALVKTDLQGRALRRIAVANHHGDVCFVEGKVYCAVNLGKFNRPAGEADSWVYVYDAGSLAELARHPVPEAVHGAGGIAYDDGRFLVVGGLPPGINENHLYEYDRGFHFRARHALGSGYTLMGIQTAAYAGGSWWFGCYGKPAILLRADDRLHLTGKWEFNASVGLVPLPDGRFLIATNHRTAAFGNSAILSPATVHLQQGLVLTPETPVPVKAPGRDPP